MVLSSEETGNGFITFDPDLPDEDKGMSLYVLCILFSVLIILSTVGRVAMKLLTGLGLSAPDYFMIITLAFNLAGNMLELQMLDAGFGRHLQYIERPEVLYLKQISQYLILMANIALWAVKISISLFVLHLIKGTHVIMTRILYALIVITTASSLGQAIFWGLQARPFHKLWNPDVPGTVQSIDTLVRSIIVFTCINSVTDLFYALSPIYFFGKLNMDLRKRLILIGLTGSGLLVFTTSIIRVAFDYDFYEPDFTWALHRVYLCTVIERNLAEIVADLPASFTIVRSLRQKGSTMLSERYGRSGSGSKAGGSTYASKNGNNSSNFGGFGHASSGGGGNISQTSSRWQRRVGAGSKNFPYGSVVETQTETDEVPLRDAPHRTGSGGTGESRVVSAGSRNIRMQTSIDISMESADSILQEEHRKNTLEPWAKVSSGH